MAIRIPQSGTLIPPPRTPVVGPSCQLDLRGGAGCGYPVQASHVAEGAHLPDLRTPSIQRRDAGIIVDPTVGHIRTSDGTVPARVLEPLQKSSHTVIFSRDWLVC